MQRISLHIYTKIYSTKKVTKIDIYLASMVCCRRKYPACWAKSATVAPESPRTCNDNRFSTSPDSETLSSSSKEALFDLNMFTSIFGCKLSSLINWWPVFLRDWESLFCADNEEVKNRKQRKKERINEAIVCVWRWMKRGLVVSIVLCCGVYIVFQFHIACYVICSLILSRSYQMVYFAFMWLLFNIH